MECLGMKKIYADPIVFLQRDQPHRRFLFSQLSLLHLNHRLWWRRRQMVHNWRHQNFWPIVKWVSTCTITTCFAVANSSTESKSVYWTGNTLYFKKNWRECSSASQSFSLSSSVSFTRSEWHEKCDVWCVITQRI